MFLEETSRELNSILRREVRLNMETRFGSGDFRRLTGAGNVLVRIMETAGVIAPAKTQSGWRQFTASDVAAARSWLAVNAKGRSRRAASARR